MTAPLLRGAGLPMAQATSLANPLTLAISLPATMVFLLIHHGGAVHGLRLPAGAVDRGASALLLAAAVPVVFVLRRRPSAVVSSPRTLSRA